MNATTKALLRNAVIEAVNNQEDAAAIELLGILAGAASINKSASPPLLLMSSKIIDGPARTYHYWIKFIRESFLPFIVDNGRSSFTSIELLSWIANNSNIQMTTGDVQARADGNPVWRNIVSDALRSLKDQGIIRAERGGKTYLIANESAGLLSCT